MKSLLFSVLLIAPWSVFAQQGKTNMNFELEIKAKEKQISEYETILKMQEQRLVFANEMMLAQEKRFESISIIITLMLGIFGLIVPLFTYLYQIRPGREAIGEARHIIDTLEQTIEKKFADFMQKEETERIDSALFNIESQAPQLIQNAVVYLNLNQYYQFTDVQLHKVAYLLETHIDENVKHTLRIILGYRKTPFADLYFKKYSTIEYSQHTIWYALTYYVNAGLSNYYAQILEIIKSQESKGNAFIDIVTSLYNINPRSSIEIINNPNIIDTLSPQERRAIRQYLNNEEGFKYIVKFLRDTYLWRVDPTE
ncbi:hypothetical protein [Leptospira venezuelensis]|nr:hypothetical protein [Leptospira venezuelensis]